MNILPAARLLLLITCLSSVSCVLGKREASVKVPAGTHPASKGAARIASVQDARSFQNQPSDPSTPSIDGDASALTPAQRENYIGRQRNGYGKGMGEVILPANGTVTAKMGEIVTEALARRGYSVGSSGTPVSVKIRQFWGWMSPGMWAITLEARIQADVAVGGRTAALEGHGRNVCQAATTANWELAYERAVADFIDKAVAAGL